MEHKWNDKDRKIKYLEKNLSQCHFGHHKTHMDWPGIELGSLWWKTWNFALFFLKFIIYWCFHRLKLHVNKHYVTIKLSFKIQAKRQDTTQLCFFMCKYNWMSRLTDQKVYFIFRWSRFQTLEWCQPLWLRFSMFLASVSREILKGYLA
jgi:hypothetical protein